MSAGTFLYIFSSFLISVGVPLRSLTGIPVPDHPKRHYPFPRIKKGFRPVKGRKPDILSFYHLLHHTWTHGYPHMVSSNAGLTSALTPLSLYSMTRFGCCGSEVIFGYCLLAPGSHLPPARCDVHSAPTVSVVAFALWNVIRYHYRYVGLVSQADLGISVLKYIC